MSEPLDLHYKPGLHIFLFFLFFILLNWPFTIMAVDHAPGSAFFLYAFATWLILVFAMFIVSIDYRRRIHSVSRKE